MGKIRVHELAKELGIESKSIAEFLKKDVKPQSGLDDADAEKVRNHFAPKEEKKSSSVLERKKSVLEKPPKEPAKKVVSPKPVTKKEDTVTGKTKTGYMVGTKPAKAKLTTAATPETESKPAPEKPTRKPPISPNAQAEKPTKKPPIAATAQVERKPVAESPAKKPPISGQATIERPETATLKDEQTESESTASRKPDMTIRKETVTGKNKEKEPVSDVSKETKEKETDVKEVKQKPSQNPEQKPAISLNIKGNVNLNQPTQKRYIAGSAPSNSHFRDNRNTDRRQGAGTRPGNDFNRTNRPGAPRDFNRPGSKPFSQGAGKLGAGNRIHVSTEPASGLSKGDVHGKKNYSHNGKSRHEIEHNGKYNEDFKNLSKDSGKKKEEVVEEKIKMITLPELITIKDLSDRTKIKAAELIKKLFLQGKMVTVNSELSYEEAENLVLEYEILCEKEVEVNVIEELLKEEEEDEKLLVKRPPVVCVMGHVDHGKTSLLDAIRETNVTSREAGGITQHIGAYMVECNGEKITFLDTPGHEAFTAMRMRGAQATDIAVLVVAADDGVMPQTIEAINHAKAAGVEVIVAVNKIDKPAANIDRVKQELAEHELVAEDWGGTTVFVPVSAKTHENIDKLLEMILLVTEVKELKANPNREMRGIVIEAKLDKGRGPVATVLVQKGTLKPGDFVSAGSFFGRVRAMLDADGTMIKTATPSTPCEILGLNGVPNAGEVCIGHKNEREAREYADTFIAEEKKKMLAETKRKLTMDTLFEKIQEGNIKELPIVVKADVQGSVEAVRTSLEKLSNEEVMVKVIHGGVGAINESDITLASASNAIVIGFNIKPDAQAKQLAETEGVDLRLYKVIYQAIDDVEAAMKGMLAPVYEEKIIGHAEVRQTFKASGVGVIAGSYVLDGTLERGCSARVTREGAVIFDGPIASLKRFKDDAKEVREGFECGIVFEKFNDLTEGDTIEAYKMVQVKRE